MTTGSTSDPGPEGEFGQCTAKHHRRKGERCQQSAVGEHGYCASHQPPDPEKTKHGRCTATAKSTGERCRNAAVGSHRKCRVHGGATPTKAENPNVGAPEGSANNLKHGVYADPLNLYRYLSDAEHHWIDSLVQGYVDHLDMEATDPRLERVLRACIHIYQSWSAEDRILEDGLSEETVVGVSENGQPILTKSAHHLHRFSVRRDKEARRLLKDLGAFSAENNNTGGPDLDLGEMSSENYTIVTNSDDADADG